SYSIAPEIPDNFVGDDRRIEQILNNLIENSVKFTAAGRISVDVKLNSQDENGAALLFCVTDTGRGIQEEFKHKVFKNFTQTDSSMTREVGGVGLGLTICKKLVKLLGGKIWFESELGKGSKFYFTLYLKLEQGVTQQEIPDTGNQEKLGVDLNILLVEDNLLNRELIKKVFELKGHKVTTANDGLECLAALAEDDFSVVVMDIQMPNMDGIDATRYIRKCEQGYSFAGHEHEILLNNLCSRIKRRYTPIVALTAHAMSGDREKCLEAGMDDYLTKPFQPKSDFQVIGRVAQEKK
ncbi:MAG: response regulator, partial [Candidatus Electrothrix sp. AR3]|nr:response regulator [Candidatus Electrothrix sp. AR3]